MHFSTIGFFLANTFEGVIRSSRRLNRLAAEIVAAANDRDVGEILVIGHSLGAVLAVDLLDRALTLDPALGARNSPVTFLTIGSSVLKIGVHNGATRFRAAVARASPCRPPSSGGIIRLALI
jgi:pimeloyl-ACP methyl ester carboxylesterase